MLVDESETAVEPSGEVKRPATQLAHPIRLSRELVLEANDIVGAGINIFGVKGSGKTVTAIRLAEQFANFLVSLVFFDIKGVGVSLVTDRRRDGKPYVPNALDRGPGRAPRGCATLPSGVTS